MLKIKKIAIVVQEKFHRSTIAYLPFYNFDKTNMLPNLSKILLCIHIFYNSIFYFLKAFYLGKSFF